MGVLEDLNRLSAAEEFFHYLDVPFEPRVLHVARLHILKRMGQYLTRAALPSSDEAQLRACCREQLAAAYADFLANTPIEARVFKVHKDAVAEKRAPAKVLVPLSPLAKKA
jgi:nitrogenase-stabilizing/protective protein